MVKVKGLFKKPWAKDLKKEDAPVVDVRDSYSQGAGRESTYEYYDDRMSVANPDNRMSTMDAFKQASMFFDYQLSQRNLGGADSDPKASLRMSTGIVNMKQSICLSSVYTDGDSSEMDKPMPARRLQPAASPSSSRRGAGNKPGSGSRGRSPLRGSGAPSLETMTEGDEDEEDSEEAGDNDDDIYTDAPPVPSKPRSLSPVVKARKSDPLDRKPSVRPKMQRNNSWTSTRDLEQTMKKERKQLSATGAKPKSKRKKKKTTSAADGEGKTLKKRSSSRSSTRKKRSGSTDKPRKGGKRNPYGKSPTRARANRSSSPEKKKAPENAARPGLMRRNSWTSNSNLNANTGQLAEKMVTGGFLDSVPEPREESSEHDEVSSKSSKKSTKSSKSSSKSLKGASNKSLSSKGRTGKKKPSSSNTRSVAAKRRSAESEKQFMADLRKSQAIAHSISLVASKDNVDKSEMDMLQKQLQEALDDAMKLKEELDKDRAELSKAAEETDELQLLLTQSAKENMELWDKIEGQEESVRKNNEAMEEMKVEVEVLKEEKAALASKVNQQEGEIKHLQSEVRLVHMHHEADDGAPSVVQELQESNQRQQKVIEEHQKELEERDAKICQLEDQLKQGPQGDVTKKLLDMAAELESTKAQLKQANLDHSVELAKKEAMTMKLQDEVNQQKSGKDQWQLQVTEKDDVLAATKDKLNAALAKIEASKHFEEKIAELERRIQDSETVEKGLQAAIDKWTDKAFEWQEKAEKLGAELDKIRENGGGGGDTASTRGSSNSVEEGITAVFGGFFGGGGQNN